MRFADSDLKTIIPTKIVGPISVCLDGVNEKICVPLATFESPLWSSTKRGAIVSEMSSGINVSVKDNGMSRSVMFYAENLTEANDCKNWIVNNRDLIEEAIQSTSSHIKVMSIFVEVVANIVYLRLNCSTGLAAGHNMITQAMDAVMALVQQNCSVSYGSISGNMCVDKKNSAINGILGRGKRCCAEILVPKKICEMILKTSSAKIVELNTKKNLLGSILAGSVRSANAHFANILLAMYLATGQDAANIVEGSQGITFAELHDEDLYFSVTLPNIIVGTIGNGKDLDFVKKNLQLMGCNAENPDSANRLAGCIAAAVLCSELSLLAAEANPGELMSAHINLERHGR